MDEQMPHGEATELVAALVKAFLPTGQIASWIGDAPFAGKGEMVHLHDPATGLPLISYHDGGIESVEAAMTAARKAQPTWMALTASQRGRVMWRIGQLVRDNADVLAELETRTAGKPIRDTRVEVMRVAEMFEYYAGWCDKLTGEVIPVPSSHLNYTRREPFGTVVQITPWNAPIFTAGWQIAPAICAGNAAVLKPSEFTPITSVALGKLCVEAGAPPGLVNVIAGIGRTAGSAAVGHPQTGLVVFVGSPETGAAIAAQAARNVVPCILELGGKSANIVFADADLDHAVLGTQAAIFSGAGQSCVAGSRLLVQESVHDRFVEQLAAAAAKIPVGQPLSETTQIGPISNARQWAVIDGFVQRSVKGGGRLATGGGKPAAFKDNKGFFYAPTVIANVGADAEIAQEEVFGPVLAAIPFKDEAEAIGIANATRFGLAGAVWTKDVARAHRVAAAIRAGTVWINSYKTINVMSPFGGFGRSGHGRSSGYDALMAYTQSKSIWVETAANPAVSFGYAPE